MRKTLTLLMAQINPTVGAIEKNAEKIMEIISAHQKTHDVIIFPELALTGYPPEDLLFRQELFDRVECALKTIMSITTNCQVILGYPMHDNATHENNRCYNMASIISNGEQITRYRKQHLPNYGIFDEERYFTKGPAVPCLFTINGYSAGLCICEDIWHPGPVEQLLAAGVEIMFCINASPFDDSKYEEREILLRKHALRGLTIVYVNQTGGQDSLVFDGQSLVMDHNGKICARAPAFATHLQTVTLQEKQIKASELRPEPPSSALRAPSPHGNKAKNLLITGEITPLLKKEALIYQALLCGLRDYVEKNNFQSVLLGLSGGIDSALTLALAVDALGTSRVHAVMLPSQYTANMSSEDALEQLRTLNVQHTTLPIEPAFATLLNTLEPVFLNRPPDTTEENLQARIRGILLMALSNKMGSLLLTTSNKSETAVGYTTLYGDMCGGFAVLKDILKTDVYALARFRNSLQPIIPERVIERPPTAELAPNQTDQDSLPDYAILDAIIHLYMNERLGCDGIILRGYKKDDVLLTIKLIKRNEYKRRQAAPGVKITRCAFDRDWRYPITSGFA